MILGGAGECAPREGSAHFKTQTWPQERVGAPLDVWVTIELSFRRPLCIETSCTFEPVVKQTRAPPSPLHTHTPTPTPTRPRPHPRPHPRAFTIPVAVREAEGEGDGELRGVGLHYHQHALEDGVPDRHLGLAFQAVSKAPARLSPPEIA